MKRIVFSGILGLLASVVGSVADEFLKTLGHGQTSPANWFIVALYLAVAQVAQYIMARKGLGLHATLPTLNSLPWQSHCSCSFPRLNSGFCCCLGTLVGALAASVI